MKEFKFKISGQDYTATVEEGKKAGMLTVTINDKSYEVEVPETKTAFPRPAALPPVTAQVGGPKSVLSELPGTVTEIKVKAGDHVKRGDVLLVIEAMKMANDIVSEVDGTIQKVEVALGANVNQGDLLIDMVADFIAAEAPALTPKPAPVAPAAVATPVAAPKPAGSNTIVAPLPGTVTKVLVKEGQDLTANDTVCMLEAMKMENTISAGVAGKVKKVLVKGGDQVQQGDVLVELA